MAQAATPPGTEFAIETKGLVKQFGLIEALRGIDFHLRTGEFLTIFGPNGAGKTTLLSILASLTKPTAGEAYVAGYSVSESDPRMRREIGVISHASFLYPDLTALENLVFYAKLYGLDQPEDQAHEALKGVELSLRRHDQVGTFSRGMVQRVSIARAMIHNPSVLFLDEPYTGLDQHASLMLEQHLKKLKTEKRTVLMTTHDFGRGLEMCDRVAVQVKGRFALNLPRGEIDTAAFEQLYIDTVEQAT